MIRKGEASMSSKFQVVKFPGRRLDGESGRMLAPLLAGAWHAGVRTVALDLASVDYIDSLGISVLISQHRKRPEEARIVLCEITDNVRDVLEVTQLFRVFDAFASVKAAESACAN
jgi:anti-anti-sigma factor